MPRVSDVTSFNQSLLSDGAHIFGFGLHGMYHFECHRTSAYMGGWQRIWLLIVSYSADLSCYQLMAKSHVCFYMRLISIFVIKSLISATFGSGPLRAECRRHEARREIFTTPGLVAARRSILGPPAEGRPGPSTTKLSY